MSGNLTLITMETTFKGLWKSVKVGGQSFKLEFDGLEGTVLIEKEIVVDSVTQLLEVF